MLSAFFDIKSRAPPVGPPPDAPPDDAGKSKRKPKRKAAAAKAPAKVQPFEATMTHAQFKPTEEGPEPQAVPESYALACQPVDAGCDDPYEYLFQEADQAAPEDDDTDSCLTFEDDGPGTDSVPLGSSPANVDLTDHAFFRKRRAKISEVPVYSGPELWYEDDDFIQ